MLPRGRHDLWLGFGTWAATSRPLDYSLTFPPKSWSIPEVGAPCNYRVIPTQEASRLMGASVREETRFLASSE
jgi:hypothetical protein